MSDQGENEEDFFCYTSGRWLWNEEERLSERYRPFDIDALKQMAVTVSGATRCAAMHKIAEGGFNKVFRLTMDNKSSLIARIPNRTSPTISYSLASEVATMDFASKILEIPVPDVLSWDADTKNPVGSEYILMREARGKPLYKIWSSLDIESKRSIMNDLVLIERRCLAASFSCYGNLYFAKGCCPPDCEKFLLTGSLSSALREEAQGCYVVGPVVADSFWDKERRQIAGVRGPWSTPQQYIRAICEREIRWLNDFADPGKLYENGFDPVDEKDPAVHIALYEKLSRASHHLLPSEPNMTRAVLWHWDLHAPNIFVHDGRITDIIDWQDCWAGPLLLQARRPALTDSETQQAMLRSFYDDETRRVNPGLSQIRENVRHSDTIRDAIRFAASTWDGNFVQLREVLMRLQRNWHEICPNHECPFAFTQEEVDTHRQMAEDWNGLADFWHKISGFVQRDGFAQDEDYDEALAFFADLREATLKSLEGEERETFERNTRWAVTEPG